MIRPASEMVREFHVTFGAPVRDVPTIDVPERDLRVALIEEEARELREALDANDIVGVADALTDLLYVVEGAALTFGIPLAECLAATHAANMRKLGPDGQPIVRESDGKIIKPEGWQGPEPDHARILAEHGHVANR